MICITFDILHRLVNVGQFSFSKLCLFLVASAVKSAVDISHFKQFTCPAVQEIQPPPNDLWLWPVSEDVIADFLKNYICCTLSYLKVVFIFLNHLLTECLK